MKLLVVDDDEDTLDILAFILRRAGFDLVTTRAGEEALSLLEAHDPALVLLDINLGERSGFDVLREVRRRSAVPVIVLTGRHAEDDKVRGLTLGADDYVTKPYHSRELLARIHAVLRRYHVTPPAPAQIETPTLLTVGPVTLDLDAHTATVEGRPVMLTVTHMRLLYYLMARAGTAVPREELLRHVWGREDVRRTDSLRAALHDLRARLGDNPEHPRFLHTVFGHGVMFQVAEQPPAAGSKAP